MSGFHLASYALGVVLGFFSGYTVCFNWGLS